MPIIIALPLCLITVWYLKFMSTDYLLHTYRSRTLDNLLWLNFPHIKIKDGNCNNPVWCLTYHIHLIILDFNMLAKFYNNRINITDNMDSKLYSSDDWLSYTSSLKWRILIYILLCRLDKKMSINDTNNLGTYFL